MNKNSDLNWLTGASFNLVSLVYFLVQETGLFKEWT